MSHEHTIAYNDLRRSLVALDDLDTWQLHELGREIDRAKMRMRCIAEGPTAAEHIVLSAYGDYISAVLCWRAAISAA